MVEEPLCLDLDSLSLDQIRQVNLLVDRFEAELRASSRPSVEAFLAEVNDPRARLVMLRLLMMTEQELGQHGVGSEGDNATIDWIFGHGGLARGGRNDLQVDRRIPGYNIVRELGRGGMGIVYLAQQSALNRLVALKVIHSGPQDGPELRERFRREAESFAKCPHPNLVRIYHVGEHAGHPYLVLEYVEGGSLDRILDGVPWAARRAAELVEPLARAMAEVHGMGIVHRDLKPANILLDATGSPKIGDFGLAKLVDQEAMLTASGTVLGTPSYMSPEQAEGHTKNVGPPSDVYALGAILYELLTGRPPFKGESAIETLKQVREVEVVAPSRLQPSIPRDLETICLTCLAKEPTRRYCGAADLADDLGRYLDGRTIKARRTPLPERVRRWCWRNPWVAASIALLVGGLGFVSFLLWKADRAENLARKAAGEAVTEAEIARAVDHFFLKDVLAQAEARSQSIAGMKPDPNLKVRTALDRAAQRISGQFTGKPMVEAAIRRTIGESYLSLGLYTQALPHLERACELFVSGRGPAHPDTLETTRLMVQLYVELDRLSDAERLTLQNLAAARGKLGEDHLETYKAEQELADLYIRREKYKEAERILPRALEGLIRLVGERHQDTLIAKQTRAHLDYYQGDLAGAERLSVEVVEARRATLGEEHPETLGAMNDLAVLYGELKKYDLAEKALRQVLDTRRRVLGAEHTSTIDSMNSLAALYYKHGDYSKAESLMVQGLESLQSVLDKDHTSILTTLNNLGSVYIAQNNLSKAEPLFVRLVEARRRLLIWDQPDTVNGMIMAIDDLSLLRVMQKDYQDAASLLEQSLALRRRRSGDGESETVKAMINLGQMHQYMGKLAEAETLFQEALRFRLRDPGVEHPATADVLENLGEVQLRQKEYVESERSLRQCLSIRTKLTPDTLQRFYIQARLGASLLGLKRYAEAEQELLGSYEGIKALAAKIPSGGGDHLHRIAGWLVELYDALGAKEKADQWRGR
jgi:eukaryotic-like serine/threonine-protein kinase